MSDLANHATDPVVEQFDCLREGCGIIDLSDQAQFVLLGEDRKGWLQGQATNNLRSMDHGASASFCICEPTGQIACVCDLWSVQDRFLISVPRVSASAFVKRVEDMVVLEDVQAMDVSNEFRVLSIQGPRATSELSRFLTLPNLDAGVSMLGEVEVFVLRSNRAGLGGWDVWIPVSAKNEIARIVHEIPSVSEEALEIARIESGIPRAGVDYNLKTLPPEMGPAFDLKHVSYTKGCYTGQEVLMRLRSRGHTNRVWVGLLLEGAVEVGDTVSHAMRPDAGTITSTCLSPDYGYIAAAMMRSDFAADRETVVVNASSGPVAAEIRTMPILRFH